MSGIAVALGQGGKACTTEEAMLLIATAPTAGATPWHLAALDEVALTAMAEAAAAVKPSPLAAVPTLAEAASAAAGEAACVLSYMQLRAAVVGALAQLMHGKAPIRVPVMRYAAALVNVVGALPACAMVAESKLAQLLPMLFSGVFTVPGVATVPAATPVTAAEAYLLSNLTGDIAAIALLGSFVSQSAALAADAAAALAVEATQGYAEPFDAEYNDLARQLPGQTASATNIRLLLEGSREVGKVKTAPPATASVDAVLSALHIAAAAPALAAAAQVHGAVSATLANASRLSQQELNVCMPLPIPAACFTPAEAGAAGAGAAAGGKGGKAKAAAAAAPAAPAALFMQHAQPLLTAITSAADAVSTLTAASAARAQALSPALAAAGLTPTDATTTAAPAGGACPTPSACSATSSVATRALCAALALSNAATALTVQIVNEVAACELLIAQREEAAAKEAAAKEARRVAAAAAREAQEAARVAAMGAEERAKYEEDAAKKREKQAKKDAKEAAAAVGAGAGAAATAASASNVLGLGPGSQEVRVYLRSQGAAPVGATALADVAAVRASIAAALDPLAAFAGTNVRAAAAGSSNVQRPDSFLRQLMDRLGSGSGRRKAKIAKGARDLLPEQMEVREKAFNTIRGVFKRHGAAEIDTPVFELRETLLGKYGEEGGKLIYDLADQGGELLSLRYDLTVPFARFLAMHGIDNIKRYHIARVYRRDNPAMSKGRFREFYQCDYDIAGVYAPMMPDAEVLSVAAEILRSLPIGEFTIKLNHRGVLDAVLEICGVPASKFRPICSAIDKLDKDPWDAVREEMIVEKGLAPEVADRIGEMVQLRGKPLELLAELRAKSVFGEHAGAAGALAELDLLFKYLNAMGVLQHLTFDLSLARGLDYYTGVIYEAVLLDPSYGVGSIAAGGRYDNLVGMFASAGTVVPCVGVSIGVERVFAIMEAKAKAAHGGLKRTPISVLVASIPSARFDMTAERMRVCADIWAAGISAEMVYSVDPKLQKQVSAAAEGDVPFMVVLGEDELARGEVQLKVMASRTASNVKRDELVASLLAAGATPAM